MLISFPPRYSIAKAVGIIKGILSGSKIFEEYPRLKKKLWGAFVGARIFCENSW